MVLVYKRIHTNILFKRNTKDGDYRWHLQVVAAFTKLIFRGFARCLHI